MNRTAASIVDVLRPGNPGHTRRRRGRRCWRPPGRRFLPVGANSQPAFAAYNRGPSGAFELHTLQVFTVTKHCISRNSVFRDAEVFASFKLPAELEV